MPNFNKYSRYFFALLVIVWLLTSAGCLKKAPLSSNNSLSSASVIFLAQAQFRNKIGEDGQTHSVPGAAKLTLVRKTYHGWESTILEDAQSNVFHKGLWFVPPEGSPGILTIGANAAALKLWHYNGRNWEDTVLWSPTFGGTQNRLRDLEVGDVTGDGIQDLVIATHDQGIIAVLQWVNGTWVVTELDRTPDTFVHEIEIGDVNGDGIQEFFATPSAPNRLDGTPQAGKIIMYRFDGERFVRSIVEELPRRHVKEILIADITGSGTPTLFAAVEGEMSMVHGRLQLLDTVKIKQYKWEEGLFSGRVIADLPDMLCRYLTAGDVDADGIIDIVASTMQSGIWILRQKADGAWEKTLIDDNSSGFEHATLIADFDSDGRQEIFVASDDQHSLRLYKWDGKIFQSKDLIPLQIDDITFGITFGHPPFDFIP